MSISLTDISEIRLRNQQISTHLLKTAEKLVNWMGAMQAQDYNQAKWAIGLRMPHLNEAQIESAFNSGEIIRTHLMRPTWHFVSSEDIYWMLELTAPRIKSLSKSRNRELGLTELVLKSCRKTLEETLQGNKSLNREELREQFRLAGIDASEQRLSHILMEAETDKVICSGPVVNKKQTYMLLEERVPKKNYLPKDESLAMLAKSYFASHGPASLADFTWWSGLSSTEARKALVMNKTEFNSAVLNDEVYWFSEPDTLTPAKSGAVFLVPAYDEYLISYKNRSAAITADHHKKAISENGFFRPVIVVDGQISGTWKVSLKKDQALIELLHFRPHSRKEELLTIVAAEKYGYFTGLKTEIKV